MSALLIAGTTLTVACGSYSNHQSTGDWKSGHGDGDRILRFHQPYGADSGDDPLAAKQHEQGASLGSLLNF